MRTEFKQMFEGGDPLFFNHLVRICEQYKSGGKNYAVGNCADRRKIAGCQVDCG